MANVQHSSLTGSDLHEPKGIAAATSGNVLIANGSGSGSWGNAFQKFMLSGTLGYVPSTSSGQDQYIRVYIPYTGTITHISHANFGSNTGVTNRQIYVYNSTGAANQVATWNTSSADYGTITSLTNTAVTAGNYLTIRGVFANFGKEVNVNIWIDRT